LKARFEFLHAPAAVTAEDDPALETTAGGLTQETGIPFLRLVRQERIFIALISMGFIAIGVVYEDAAIARWVGFGLAGYSAVANDSIQTIGTFIASNKKSPWWLLWIFIGGLFVATVAYSFVQYDGDVTYERLTSKGFAETPMSFAYLQVAAPLVLMVLTRLRMPVSTTFLLLSCFATDPSGVGAVLIKSLSGYGVAFVAAIVVWFAVSKTIDRFEKKGAAHPGWRVFQWISSGALWSVWIMQDAANIAVYLPRKLELVEFLAFAGTVFLGLGLLFKLGGEKVQEIVDEKSGIEDVRSASVVDFVYAIILYIFKFASEVPMSTTWVFIGLLGGRELAMAAQRVGTRDVKGAGKLMAKDAMLAGIGLVVSIALAMAVNDKFREGLLGTAPEPAAESAPADAPEEAGEE